MAESFAAAAVFHAALAGEQSNADAIAAAAKLAVATAGGDGDDRTADRSVATSDEAGFFAVGVYNSKSAENVGTLWRSAFQLGASYIFTIGARSGTGWDKMADTYRSWRHIPAFRFKDWGSFCAAAPYSAVWVAIEMGGTPLAEFEHPHNAVYILGSEDAGLPPSILSACHEVVSIPSERYSSYNVASAGSIVLYDRLAKKERRKERE